MWMISNGKQSITLSISMHQRRVTGAQKNQGEEIERLLGNARGTARMELEQREGGELSSSIFSLAVLIIL